MVFHAYLPGLALMFVYPELLLSKLYGAEYASGALVLRILALGFVTNSYFGFCYHNLIASGDSDFLLKCSVASAGVNVLLNFLLIPHFGMAGAAIASAVSFASIEVLMTIRTWRKQHMHPFTSMYRKLTLIGALMVMSMLAAKNALLLSGVTWEDMYIVFVAVYFLIVQRAKVLDKTEIKIIGEIRKTILYNIGVRVPQAIKTLAS